MTAGLQREFPVQSVRSGSHSRVYSTIHCSKCSNQSTIDTAQTIPDKQIRQKFERRGWLLSRTRRDDVCPTCLGVKPENRLANRFKVTSADGPVPTPAECSRQAGRERDQRNAATHALIARTFGPKPAASPAPAATEPAPTPPVLSEPDARVGLLERELSEIRAASELQIETNAAILTESRRTNEMLQVSLQQNAQMIEAIARMAGTSGRQGETILSAVGQAANALTRLARMAEERARPVEEIAALPAPEPVLEPEPEPEAAPVQTAAPRLRTPPRPRAPRSAKPGSWSGLAATRARREARRKPTLIAAE